MNENKAVVGIHSFIRSHSSPETYCLSGTLLGPRNSEINSNKLVPLCCLQLCPTSVTRSYTEEPSCSPEAPWSPAAGLDSTNTSGMHRSKVKVSEQKSPNTKVVPREVSFSLRFCFVNQKEVFEIQPLGSQASFRQPKG